jgi:energy-converting hydrogenase Eha subunit H
VPIRNVVKMTLYLNETGNVDDVVIDEKGDLSDAEQKKLIDGFGLILFTPGMRGEKVVKSLYRVRLEVNRKLIIYRNTG